MKTSVKVALGVSLIWIIISLTMFLLGYSREFFTMGILLNIFLLMAAISYGYYLTKKEKDFAKTIFLDDFKIAMQSGLMYTIVVSGFTYLYHETIDTSIKDALVESRIELLHETYPDEAAFQKLQETEVQWKDKNYDVYIEEQEDYIRGIISSFSVFIFHLMGLFIFAMFFSIFGTVIIRMVILRE